MTYARICEVRPRKDKRGFDLISDALPFGRLWYGQAAPLLATMHCQSKRQSRLVSL
jgi:hypothetical protein